MPIKLYYFIQETLESGNLSYTLIHKGQNILFGITINIKAESNVSLSIKLMYLYHMHRFNSNIVAAN